LKTWRSGRGKREKGKKGRELFLTSDGVDVGLGRKMEDQQDGTERIEITGIQLLLKSGKVKLP